MGFTTDDHGNRHGTNDGRFQEKPLTDAEVVLDSPGATRTGRYDALLQDSIGELIAAESRAQGLQIARLRAKTMEAYPDARMVHLRFSDDRLIVESMTGADGEQIIDWEGALEGADLDLMNDYEDVRRCAWFTQSLDDIELFTLHVPEHDERADELLSELEARAQVKAAATAAGNDVVMPALLDLVARRGVKYDTLGKLSAEQITELFDTQVAPALDRIAQQLR